MLEDGQEVWKVYQKHYLGDASKQAANSWADLDGNKKGSKEVKALFDGRKLFDYPKPVQLVRRLIDLSVDTDELIMDFFAGSGTTAQAVFELNREDGAYSSENDQSIQAKLSSEFKETDHPRSEATQASLLCLLSLGLRQAVLAFA